MVIYNKGKRSYDIDVNIGTSKSEKVDIKRLDPGKTIEVSKDQGENLVRKYHRDLVDHEDMTPGKKSHNEQVIADLRAENKELREKIKKLEVKPKSPKPAKK